MQYIIYIYSIDIVHKINVYNLCTIWELAVIDLIEELIVLPSNHM